MHHQLEIHQEPEALDSLEGSLRTSGDAVLEIPPRRLLSRRQKGRDGVTMVTL